MKHLKRYNENIETNELFISGQTRYSELYWMRNREVNKGKLHVKAERDGSLSFQTDEMGVKISDINQLEDLIEFLMYHRDKSI